MKLSGITIEDTPLLFELVERNREQLKEYFPITSASTKDLESTHHFIEERILQQHQRQGYYFLMIAEETVVGAIGIKTVDWTVPKCELAYFTDKELQGKGFCTKAIDAIVNYCFEELGMERVYARISPDNIGSRRALEKNGFNKEGLLKKDFRNGNNVLVDVEYYGKLKTT